MGLVNSGFRLQSRDAQESVLEEALPFGSRDVFGEIMTKSGSELLAKKHLW